MSGGRGRVWEEVGEEFERRWRNSMKGGGRVWEEQERRKLSVGEGKGKVWEEEEDEGCGRRRRGK